MDAGGLFGSAAGLAGGLIGHFASEGDQDQANALLQAGYQKYLDLGAPPDQAKQLLLKEYKEAGKLTPALEQQINAGPSAVAGITEDPSLQNAQMGALQQLQQRAQGGLTPEERAQYVQSQIEAQRAGQAKNAQILQQMQASGQGGSGAQLAAQLSASQNGTNEAAQGGLNLASLASQNALNASSQSGQLGGQIRGQNFNVADTKAQAADQLNRFNVQNQIANQQRNVGSQNRAQEANLNNSQQIANANTGMANQEQLRELQGARQTWQDKATLAGMQSGALIGQAGGFQNQANQTAGMWNGLGKGVGQMGAAAFSTPKAPVDAPKDEGKWTGGRIPNYAEGGQISGEWEAGDHNGPAGYYGGEKIQDDIPNINPQEAKKVEQGLHESYVEPANWLSNLKSGLGMTPSSKPSPDGTGYAQGGAIAPVDKNPIQASMQQSGLPPAVGMDVGTWAQPPQAKPAPTTNGDLSGLSPNQLQQLLGMLKPQQAPQKLADGGMVSQADLPPAVGMDIGSPSSGGGDPTSGLSSLAQLAPLAAMLKDGGRVPGQAPYPNRNTPKNDVVTAKVTPGELVVPLTDACCEDKAKKFITRYFKKEQGK